jgi:uncharacterized protein (TIGR02246 family)
MTSHKSNLLGSKPDDGTAIRTLYQQTIDGWNTGSGDAFAAPYTDDSDFVGFDGTYLKGRQQIASFHQMLFDKFLKGSCLIGKIRSIRFVTNYIAIMIAVGGTVMAGQSDIEPERNSIHAIVAVKRDSSNCILLLFKIRVNSILEDQRNLKRSHQNEGMLNKLYHLI